MIIQRYELIFIYCVHNIKYISIQVPHAFKISREGGKAVFRYKLFAQFNEWLPNTPTIPTEIGTIVIPEHSALGGVDPFITHLLGGAEGTNTEPTETQKTIMRQLEGVNLVLRQLDSASVAELVTRVDAQAEGVDQLLTDSAKNKAELEAELERKSTLSSGMLCMLCKRSCCTYYALLYITSHDLVGYIWWIKDPENKIKDISPSPLDPMSPKAIGASKKAYDVAKFMLQEVKKASLGVSAENTYNDDYYCPPAKKMLTKAEYDFYVARASSWNDVLSMHRADVECAPAWAFVPEPSSDVSARFTETDRARRSALETAELAELDNVVRGNVVRPGYDHAPDEELLNRHGRSTADAIEELDRAKLIASVGNKGYSVEKLRCFCQIENLPVSGTKAKLRDRLMRALGIFETSPLIAAASQVVMPARNSTGKQSVARRNMWAANIIQRGEQVAPSSSASLRSPQLVTAEAPIEAVSDSCSDTEQSTQSTPIPPVAPTARRSMRRDTEDNKAGDDAGEDEDFFNARPRGSRKKRKRKLTTKGTTSARRSRK